MPDHDPAFGNYQRTGYPIKILYKHLNGREARNRESWKELTWMQNLIGLNQMKLTPLNDYIAVIEVSKPAKVGALFIPETAKSSETFRRGEVVGVGAGRVSISGERVPPSVKIGDIVVFEKSSGIKLSFPERIYFLLGEDSVLAKVEI